MVGVRVGTGQRELLAVKSCVQVFLTLSLPLHQASGSSFVFYLVMTSPLTKWTLLMVPSLPGPQECCFSVPVDLEKPEVHQISEDYDIETENKSSETLRDQTDEESPAQPCRVVGKSQALNFSSGRELYLHFQEHSSDERHLCLFCEHEVNDPEGLHSHVSRLHTNVNRYVAIEHIKFFSHVYDDCGKGFSSMLEYCKDLNRIYLKGFAYHCRLTNLLGDDRTLTSGGSLDGKLEFTKRLIMSQQHLSQAEDQRGTQRKGNWKVEGGLPIKVHGEIPAHCNCGTSTAEEEQQGRRPVAQSEEIGVRGLDPADEKRHRAKNQGHRHRKIRQQHQALPIRDFIRNDPARVDHAVYR
ncbi:hypothetical protein Celaphus_00005927 [Cervus elaphus hippelaphus]|uniref:C2H2-type domain-containing protein n=1 Tax=Cervus elaphus hippelaphus TaxID=46360 RepID=A0A212CUC7_CEREH|nr:hypothetical protein Celaphus_00005927 [Cervus elaphus hippelaphus]